MLVFLVTEFKYVSFTDNIIKSETLTLCPILCFLTLSCPLPFPFQVIVNEQF